MPDADRSVAARIGWCLGAVAVLAVASACSSGSPVTGGSAAPGTSSASSPASSSEKAPASSASSAAKPGLAMTVTPAKRLRDHQMVRVSATGFTPHEALQVIECADKAAATGPSDCNLVGMQAATADAAGRVSARVAVTRGPFGGNNVTCSSEQRCLVSVSQATLTPTEEAHGEIEFIED